MVPLKVLFLLLAVSAAPFGSAADAAGAVAFLAGMAVETASEVQRKAFKDDPRNAGRPHAGGLFALSRHVNYFGDALAFAGFVRRAARPPARPRSRASLRSSSAGASPS